MKPKDTYESLMTYLNEGQEQIKYPDRLAAQLGNSHKHQKRVYKKEKKAT
jgi:methylphosphotriester-DNA--protein-cysteine methyltransferase